ncbi:MULTISPECIES: metal-dependent hydrolase family protein [Leeuwenhoekiella]|jgi:imidazolonepropionase-like amidohydrolase|uniref:Xaa-Pro dipeptidase family enzyme n=1 Tax=Leeuwenhoekiella blandensis (strain CECT 7118 / CCUG 51940 / KCTC 22103 / MED217) TaxID=398720 RepID=A3XKT6_LEEBM|nr:MULTISPECIES: amidohydrolase family protein [Leeuwenhoekiella]EAQ49842.1 Xaa-Pro dipeptidase family enzyme [Leeuwenhoekiella blandensis MED217]MAO42515.1 amidohydrolase family protein [Leeuwenhoekiella sp.]HCW64105.1 amidohydrolase family protein [Leeuwenhoekiella sp.]|tara:strand:+ start:459 stop:1730 length:1272 start_codon:yes stop_codon:yes gene_type:complete
MRTTLLSLILAIVSLSAFAQKTYLQVGKLVDTKNGKILTEKTIIVSGDEIEDVVDGYQSGDGEIIDLKDKVILPGFADLHVHIEGETSPTQYLEEFTLNEADVAYKAQEIAFRTLMAGFTTVRDLGGSGVNVSLRNAINTGKVIGPRIYTAEKAIGTTGGHADPTNGYRKDLMGDPGPKEGVVNNVDDARKAVRQRYKNGADWIKITATGGVLSVAKNGQNPQFTEEEIEAIVTTGKDYDLQVAAHAHGDDGMQRAVKAGVKTIEHGTLMSEATADLMVEHGTYYVPTLSAGKYVAEKAKIKDYYPAIIVPKALEIGPQLQKTFAMAYKKGVNIAFGTDAGVFPHGDNAKEFGYMVEAGMPAMKAIQSATIESAKVLKAEDKLGQVAPGFKADIIAVNEDPIKNIDTLNEVIFVMKSGQVVKE